METAAILTLVRSPKERSCARLLLDSLRTFGGSLRHCPIWIFEADSQSAPCSDLQESDVRVVSLEMPGDVRYFFADKVFACAQAEEMLEPETACMIWIDPACLVVAPPELYLLGAGVDAAVRPVHITNVGLPAGDPLDAFWGGVYDRFGIHDIESTVDTFVDGQRIRSYFNSHAFSVNPSRKLMRRWYKHFEALVGDDDYQQRACQDQLHRIFLHQAALSALLSTEIEPARLRILPPEYNYPYNLHPSVPAERRAAVLNDLVSITYEDRSLNPTIADDIEIREPLRTWLSDRTL